MTQFDKHCNPQLNETVERYKFFVRDQGQNESIDRYVTDLRVLASTCNFGDIKDSLIRDRIVCGTQSPAMRERLLREQNLTLDKCMQICRATEVSKENSKTIQGKTVEEIHAMKKNPRRDKKEEINCNFCGNTHEKNKHKCPACGKKCKKCGKENHFAAKCKSKFETNKKGRPVHTISESSESCEDIMTITDIRENQETINQVKEAHSKSQHLFAGMLLDKKLVNFQIDCGATCNVIQMQLLNPSVKLDHTEKVLVMYNKSRLRPLGKCKVKLRNPRNYKLYRLEFQVVDQEDSIPLLGRKASEAMKLIKVQYENILAIDSIEKTQ